MTRDASANTNTKNETRSPTDAPHERKQTGTRRSDETRTRDARTRRIRTTTGKQMRRQGMIERDEIHETQGREERRDARTRRHEATSNPQSIKNQASREKKHQITTFIARPPHRVLSLIRQPQLVPRPRAWDETTMGWIADNGTSLIRWAIAAISAHIARRRRPTASMRYERRDAVRKTPAPPTPGRDEKTRRENGTHNPERQAGREERKELLYET